MDNKDFKFDLQLFADDEGKDKDKEGEKVNLPGLEEALGKAVDAIAIKAKTKEPLPPIDEEDEEDEEEEEEKEIKAKKAKKSEAAKKSENDDEEPDFEQLSKGLEEDLLEKEEDATQEIIDAVPFVKALIDSLDNQISELIKAIVYLSDEQVKIKKSLRKSGDLDVAQAKLIKSMSENMRKMGETPLPRKSILGKNFEIIQKAGDGGEKIFSLTKLQAIDRLTELCKTDKISLEELQKAEWRIQKGVPLEGELDHLNGLLSK